MEKITTIFNSSKRIGVQNMYIILLIVIFCVLFSIIIDMKTEKEELAHHAMLAEMRAARAEKRTGTKKG